MQDWAPPQYSDDGRWWWNGQRWVPVTWPAPAPAIYEWEPRYDRTVTAGRHRLPGAFWIGLLALMLLLGLAAGGGAVSWVVQQGRGLGAGTAPVPAVPVPTAPAPAPTAPGSEPSPASSSGGPVTTDGYRQVVVADVARFQSASQTVADGCSPAALSSGIGDCQAALRSLDAAVQGFQSDLDANPAPSCLQPADRELRAALALYHQGVQQELDGLQRGDPGAVLRGAGTLGEATGRARAAGSLLQSAC